MIDRRPAGRTFHCRSAGALLGALLAVCALAAPALAAQEKSAFSEAQRDEIRKMVREYIVANPEAITEAIQVLQDREEAQRAEKQKATLVARHKELFEPEENTVIGNPKGDVTIVEFFDYNCTYCKTMFPNVMDIIKQDSKIRLVMKEFPILGAASVTASRAALASRKQGKYKEFHLALLGHKGSLTDDLIFQTAADVGLDKAKLTADMKAKEIDEIIENNRSLARELALSGTPALVVGDTLVPGAVGKEALLKLVADARK